MGSADDGTFEHPMPFSVQQCSCSWDRSNLDINIHHEGASDSRYQKAEKYIPHPISSIYDHFVSQRISLHCL